MSSRKECQQKSNPTADCEGLKGYATSALFYMIGISILSYCLQAWEPVFCAAIGFGAMGTNLFLIFKVMNFFYPDTDERRSS